MSSHVTGGRKQPLSGLAQFLVKNVFILVCLQDVCLHRGVCVYPVRVGECAGVQLGSECVECWLP